MLKKEARQERGHHDAYGRQADPQWGPGGRCPGPGGNGGLSSVSVEVMTTGVGETPRVRHKGINRRLIRAPKWGCLVCELHLNKVVFFKKKNQTHPTLCPSDRIQSHAPLVENSRPSTEDGRCPGAAASFQADWEGLAPGRRKGVWQAQGRALPTLSSARCPDLYMTPAGRMTPDAAR